jgi:hypothetical protein
MKMPPVIPLVNLHVDNVKRDLRYWHHRVFHLSNGIRLDGMRKIVWKAGASLRRKAPLASRQSLLPPAVPSEVRPLSSPPLAPLLIPAMAAATGAGVWFALTLSRRR